jgi:hypothetical protein
MWNRNFANPHSDVALWWLTPTEVRFDKYTSDYDITGLAAYTDGGNVTLKRVNYRNCVAYPSGHYAIWHEATTRFDIDRLYLETGWGLAEPNTVDFPGLGPTQFTLWGGAWGGSLGTTTNVGDGKSQGSYMDITDPVASNIYGVGGANARVFYGSPPVGDYVPVDIPGTTYASPGYL